MPASKKTRHASPFDIDAVRYDKGYNEGYKDGHSRGLLHMALAIVAAIAILGIIFFLILP